MKKTKILTPIIGAAATIAAITPCATMTSCSQNTKYELVEGQSKEYATTINGQRASFTFKQSNPETIHSTKVSISNLRVNGASASMVSGLYSYVCDSAGNILLSIKLNLIKKQFPNASYIEFDVNFFNKEDNSSATIKDFKIIFEEQEGIDVTLLTNGATATEYTYNSVDGSKPTLGEPYIFNLTVPNNVEKTIPTEFEMYCGDTKLAPDTDYTFSYNNTGKSATITIKNVTGPIKIDLVPVDMTYCVYFVNTDSTHKALSLPGELPKMFLGDDYDVELYSSDDFTYSTNLLKKDSNWVCDVKITEQPIERLNFNNQSLKAVAKVVTPSYDSTNKQIHSGLGTKGFVYIFTVTCTNSSIHKTITETKTFQMIEPDDL